MNSVTETFFEGLSSGQLGIIDNILSTAISEDAADRDPQQIQDIVPVEEWLNYRHFMGPFSKSLYPYWKDRLPIYINSGSPELVLSGSIGGGKCIPGHVRVSSELGYLPISEILPELHLKEPGYVELEIKVSSNSTVKRTSHFYTENKCKVYNIKLSNNAVKSGTGKHRIAVYEPESFSVVLKRMDDIKIGDQVALSQNIENPCIQELITPEQAWFLGFWAGDGSYGISKKLQMCGSMESLNALETVIGSSKHRTKDKRREDLYCIEYLKEDTNVPWECIRVSDSSTKYIPEEVFKSSSRVRAAFIEGYLHTDGSVSNMGKVEWTSKSSFLIYQLYDLLESLGIHSRLSDKHHPKHGLYKRLVVRSWSREKLFSILPGMSYKGKTLKEAIDRTQKNSRNERNCISVSEKFKCFLRDWGKSFSVSKKDSRFKVRSNIYAICEQSTVAVRTLKNFDMWFNTPSEIKELTKYTYEKVISVSTSIEDVYDLTVPETEEFIAQGMRNHNTFFALICCIRKLYELSCFRYPQRLFGLSDISDIFFAYLSINYKHAERTGYGQLRSMLDEIPYFQKDFPRDEKIDSILKFPARIGIIPGTDNLSVISMNLYGCIDDEADFHRQGATSAFGDVQKASAIYREVTDRRVSRFMVKGKDPGFSAIISSASFQSSFVAQRIKKAKENKSCVFISRLWDVQPEKYSPERFWVFKGTDKKDAFVVNSLNDVIDIAPPEIQSKISEKALVLDSTGDVLIGDVIKVLPEKFSNNFLDVPSDFRPNFGEDIYGALRNLGGVAVSPTGKLFSSRAVWRMCLDDNLQHPFTKQTFSVTVRGKDHVLDFFRPEILFDEIAKGKWKLKRHPNAPRFAHIDQSVSKDRTGIAIVHISDYVTDRDTMLVVPKIETDLKVAIFAPPNEKIMIAKCRKFIFDLRAMGMMFGKVTYDQYQSTDSIQIMEVNGIPSANLSVDRDDRAYLQFTNLLYETRISFYEYSIFESEFFELDHDPVAKKVDHPEKGSKDVCDAMVGATFNALESLAGLPHVSNEDVVGAIITDVTPTREVQEKDDWLYPEYKGFERPGEEKKKVKIIGMIGGEQFGGNDGAIFTGRTFM